MRLRLPMLACALVVAGGVLVACGDDVRADGETIEACERWTALRGERITAEQLPEVAAIAELATDPAVASRASALVEALSLDFTGSLGPSRAARLDAACADATGRAR